MPVIKSANPVLDDAGDPAAGRVVRVYRRDTGALVAEGETSDGANAYDDAFGNVKLLLPLRSVRSDGTAFDMSLSNASGVITGAKISGDQTVFGAATTKFNAGASEKITIGSSSQFHLASGSDFCVEGFFFRTAGAGTSGAIFALNGSPRWSFFWRGATNKFAVYQEVVGTFIESAETLALNTWYFFRVRRVGGVVYLSLNGGSEVSTSNSSASAAAPEPVVGWASGSEFFSGHIAQIRYTVGSGRAAAATPSDPYPTTDELLGAGHYKVNVPFSGEVNVVCLDDDAGDAYNDLILRTTPV